MTKSKSGEVVDFKMTFVLLPLGKYLFSAVSDNGYITGSNKENVLSIAISANVSDAKRQSSYNCRGIVMPRSH